MTILKQLPEDAHLMKITQGELTTGKVILIDSAHVPIADIESARKATVIPLVLDEDSLAFYQDKTDRWTWGPTSTFVWWVNFRAQDHAGFLALTPENRDPLCAPCIAGTGRNAAYASSIIIINRSDLNIDLRAQVKDLIITPKSTTPLHVNCNPELFTAIIRHVGRNRHVGYSVNQLLTPVWADTTFRGTQVCAAHLSYEIDMYHGRRAGR